MSQMDLQQCKNSRKTRRAVINKLLTKIAADIKSKDFGLVEVDLAQLLAKETALIVVNEQLELLSDAADFESEILENENYADNIITAKVTAERFLKTKDQTGRAPSSPGTGAQAQAQIKLPKLEIARFGGAISDWERFWDQFAAGIHANQSLSNVDKFNYLRGLLTDSAAKPIQGLKLTDANYGIAVDLLTKKYGKADVLVNEHVTKLLHCKPVQIMDSGKDLRRFLEEFQLHMRALEALGTSVISMGALLCPIVREAIPVSILLEWNRLTHGKQETDLTALLGFIEQELEGIELAWRAKGEFKDQGSPSQKTESQTNKVRSPQTRSQSKTSASALLATENPNQRKPKTFKGPYCLFCAEETHISAHCTRFKTNSERYVALRRQNRCLRCMAKGHFAKDCRTKLICRSCQQVHHTLTCPRRDQQSVPTQSYNNASKQGLEDANAGDPIEPSNTATVTSVINPVAHKPRGFVTVLQLIRIWVRNGRKTQRVVMLLDGGSERSFVTKRVVNLLGIKGQRSEILNVRTFGGGRTRQKSKLIPLHLGGMGQQRLQIEAFEVEEICSGVSLWETDQVEAYLRYSNQQSWNQAMGEGSQVQVDILIGADWYWHVMTGKTKKITTDLQASESIFGWMLLGRGATTTTNPPVITMLVGADSVPEHDQLNQDLQKFWKLDQSGIMESENQSEQTLYDIQVMEEFRSTTTFNGTRYRVRIPWNERKVELGTNQTNARKRLKGLSKRIHREEDLFQRYRSGINDHLNNKHAEEVDSTQPTTNAIYYMPHHPVIDEERLTTKMRIVFDASAHEGGHASLNECQHAGPDLNPNLLEILLRFRSHQIGIISDISKAYLQIQLHPEDQDTTRFFWTEEEWTGSDEPPIKTLRMVRVPFGMRASAYLLAATIRLHTEKYEQNHAATCNVIKDDMYVDDLVSGQESTDQAYQTYQEIGTILLEGGFPLSKWCTNNQELEARWRQDGVITKETPTDPRKVLGMMWDFQTDKFSFRSSKLLEAVAQSNNTKRGMLEILARIYDPLGIVSPKTIEAKYLIQRVWKQGVPWDEPLDDQVSQLWNDWKSDLTMLNQVTIPRWNGDIKESQLHIFCDASPKAYGVAAYLRSESKEGTIQANLVASKGKIAPIKAISIPRLELIACLIGSRLQATIKRAWKMHPVTVHCWTDSLVAMQWLQKDPGQWKLFIGRRVQEIQTCNLTWMHCPGKDNPADLISRGESLSKLQDDSKWWHGPSWLTKDETQWPSTPDQQPTTEVLDQTNQEARTSEIKSCTVVVNNAVVLFDHSQIETWRRITRITAWVLRFISNCKKPPDDRLCDQLTIAELSQAEKLWLRYSQDESFPKEKEALLDHKPINRSSPIFPFHPFMGTDGLIRLGGRLKFAPLEDDIKHPVLIKPSALITKLILDRHKASLHGGVQVTLIKLRETAWILRGRQSVRKAIHECIPCRRWDAKPIQAIEGPLPENRITDGNPFQTTGVDFAGPIWIKAGRQKTKGYICLFTCAVTRAVHLELTPALSTEAFLLALRRFTARRGCCKTIYSDNAQAFKQTDRVLKAAWKNAQSDQSQTAIVHLGIQWKFIPPKAAWWGGFYERLVGSVKRHLRRVLGNASLNVDELYTILVEIESAINSRPLSTLSDDPNDEEILTPFHFLIGQSSQTLPDVADGILAIPAKPILRRRWRYRRRLMDNYWKKWVQEYLLQLQTAHRVRHSQTIHDLKIGDLVIVKQDLIPRGQWKMARITELKQGRDNQIRSVTLRTTTGSVLRRAVQHICPLELTTNPEGTGR